MTHWRVVVDGRVVAHGLGWDRQTSERVARICIAYSQRGKPHPVIELRIGQNGEWFRTKEVDHED